MGEFVEIFHQDVEDEVTCATFSNDLEILVLGFENGVVSIFNVLKKRHVADLEPTHSACITALAISPSSKWISVGRATGSLANFLTRTAYLEQVVMGHKNLVHCVQFSADSTLLISASACGLCTVYSLDEEKPLWQITLPHPCLSCSISCDNRVVAMGTTDGGVYGHTWQPGDSAARAAHLALCQQLERRLKSAAAFHSCPMVVGAGVTLTLPRYRGHSSPVTALAFARGSRLLATGGSHDRLVTVVSWDRLEVLARLAGHESWVSSLRWGRGDLCLLSCAEHDCAKLWAATDGAGAAPAAAAGEFRPLQTTVSLETLQDVMHCQVESPGCFVVAGCCSGGGTADAEFELDERDLLLTTPAAEEEEEEAEGDTDGDEADDG